MFASSHKRDVPWQPTGVGLANASGNTRMHQLDDAQRELFVELTGKAGSAVIFTHDLM